MLSVFHSIQHWRGCDDHVARARRSFAKSRSRFLADELSRFLPQSSLLVRKQPYTKRTRRSGLLPSYSTRCATLAATFLFGCWVLYMASCIALLSDNCASRPGGCDATERASQLKNGVGETYHCRTDVASCSEEGFDGFSSTDECERARRLSTALDISCVGASDGDPKRGIATSMADLFTHLKAVELKLPYYFEKPLHEPPPYVSVIIPVSNAASFLRYSVESILRQTYTNFELILVDDLSTDDSLKVCHELAYEDNRIKVLQIPWGSGSGPYVAKNYGMLHSVGRYIAFQDSDDISHPRRIEAQVRFLDSHERAVYVTSNYIRIAPNFEILSNRGKSQRTSLQASMFRRYLNKHIGFMDTVKVSADAEFYWRMIAFYGYKAKGVIDIPHAHLNVSIPLYYAFHRRGSLSQNAAHGYAISSSEISGARKTYEDAFKVWHAVPPPERRIDPTTGRGFVFMDFPLRRRPFTAPATHVVQSPFFNQSVVAMMTTHRGRIHEFDDAVLSVAPYVDKMFIYLNDLTIGEIPISVRQLHNVEVFQSFEGNIQDNGKFVAVDRIARDAYVLTVDDDIIYPKDYVRRMIMKVEEYGRKAVVGVHCITLTKEQERYYDVEERRSVRSFQIRLDEDEPAHVLGTGTAAWHASALPDISLSDFPKEHVGMADIWMTKYAREHGLDLRCISRGDNWLQKAEKNTSSIWSRHVENGVSDDKQVEVLHDLYPEYFRSDDEKSSVAGEWILDKVFG